MANLITLLRFGLLFVLVAMAYQAPPVWQLINMPLLFVIIALDGLDGYVARKRHETTAFGSIFDIAVDRIVEYVLWIVLADLDLIPIWVALVFIVRGTIVDSIRYGAITDGETAFGMMRSPIGKFLVAGRFMRGFYGTVKAITFGWVLLMQPLPAVDPGLWATWHGMFNLVTAALVGISVTICLVRGLPVIIEFAMGSGLLGPHSTAGDRR